MFFPPSRSAALDRLEKFLPHAAKYAGTRNFDLGSENHSGVSQLSPYIRTRLITEEEVTRAVLEKHSAKAAEKYLQEIAWRTYWKGWMESRPSVWDHYTSSLAELSRLTHLPDYTRAVSAQTGIECFDAWATELRDTGYLHNHARMWFASIWIFTLRLPWQLGADFFLHHLLDADAAANTLSWRWVAGIHTKGKHYLARASNIQKFTHGRFDPEGSLDEQAMPITDETEFEKAPLRLPQRISPQGRVGHLMFSDDLAPIPAESMKVAATAAFIPPPLLTSPLVTEFITGAVSDALERSEGTLLSGSLTSAVQDWILAEKLDHIVISYPTVGPTREFLKTQRLSIEPNYFLRDWDRQLWPHAHAGFFKLKKALPKIFASLTYPRADDLFPDL